MNRNNNKNRIILGVIGVGNATSTESELAYQVGRWIGSQGLTMVCGGREGVMLDASRGCQESGGKVIGLLPGIDKTEANPFVDFAIPTGMGQARNTLIAHTADALIAIGQGYGTLSEIALGLKLGKAVYGLASWEIPGMKLCKDLEALKDALGPSLPTI